MVDSGAFGKAFAAFPAELGKRIQERRSAVMTQEFLAYLLEGAGIAMTPEDVAALEAGEWPNLDLRLLAALVFLLEISLDEALLVCFRDSAAASEA
jgi:hypothetical protein